MKKDYTKYTAAELLQDDFFVSSVLNPTEETDLFWKIQVEDGIIAKNELQAARLFLSSMRVKKQRMTSSEYQFLWKRINNSKKQFSPRKGISFHTLYMVASIALLVIGGLWFFLGQNKDDESLLSVAQMNISDMDLTEVHLILADNERISLNEDTVAIQYDSKGNILVNSIKIEQENVSHNTQKETKATKKINQLIVSKGKRSTLKFPDGTIVWVNAGSRVIYPEQFDSKKREIYVDGEVYLNVSNDPHRPFIVKTQHMDVRVLGTSFNITAYQEENMQMVALVEGEVEIISKKEKLAKLVPNDLFRNENGIVSIEQTDVSNYISWIEGLCIYQSERLPVILDRLSRYYGKNIQYNKDIEHIRCSGKLDLKDDLSKVLDALIETAPILYNTENENYCIFYARKQ